MKFDRALLNNDTYLFLGYDKGQEVYCLRNIICTTVMRYLVADVDVLRVRKRSADSFNIKMLLYVNSDNKVCKASYVSTENPNKSILINSGSSEYILALRDYIMEYNNIELLRSE